MTPRADVVESIAEHYAEALLEVTAERGTTEAVAEEFDALVGLMDAESQFEAFVGSAAIEDAPRRRSLRRVFGGGRLHEALLSLLLVMNDKGRLGLLRAVHRAFAARRTARAGYEPVRVTTAAPLEAELRERLTRRLGELLDRRPLLSERVDPAVLGGLLIEVGDRRLDATLRGRLQRMAAELKRAARRQWARGPATE